jgi:nucleoside-diphosphate-sugar epimerase
MTSRRRVLVLGASGFIGRNLAEAFAEDERYEVTGVCFTRAPFGHRNIRFARADLRKPDDIDRVMQGADIVLQAAATTSGAKDIVTRPYIHVTDNAVMNALLLRAAFEHRVRHFVYFSCTTMYHQSDRPLRECDYDPKAELHPNYFSSAWTKVYIEKMCEFFGRISDTRYTVVRHSNVYGPHDKFDLERSHVFGATVTKVMTARDGRLGVWGSGEEARDFLYVSDLIGFVRLAIDRQPSPFEIYNVGAGQATPIRELVESIVRASGRSIRVDYDASRPTIKTTLRIDCGKARGDLGWQPVVSLPAGIARTVAWYREAFRDRLASD